MCIEYALLQPVGASRAHAINERTSDFQSSRVEVRSNDASADSGVYAGMPLIVGGGVEVLAMDVSSASRRSSSAVETSSMRSTSPTEYPS